MVVRKPAHHYAACKWATAQHVQQQLLRPPSAPVSCQQCSWWGGEGRRSFREDWGGKWAVGREREREREVKSGKAACQWISIALACARSYPLFPRPPCPTPPTQAKWLAYIWGDPSTRVEGKILSVSVCTHAHTLTFSWLSNYPHLIPQTNGFSLHSTSTAT